MSMSFDFNDAGQQEDRFSLIPAKTVVPVIMTVRPGGSGEGGWLKPSQSSDAEMLDCEFAVTSGPYANRKFWQMFTVSGGKLDENGESIGARISRQSLRAMLESSRRINPDDMSDNARKARCITGWGDFNGLQFWVRMGIKKDKTGRYDDQNMVEIVLTPDMKEYGKCSEPASKPASNSWAQQPAKTTAAATWGNTQPANASQGWGQHQAAAGNPQPQQPQNMQPSEATPTPGWAK